VLKAASKRRAASRAGAPHVSSRHIGCTAPRSCSWARASSTSFGNARAPFTAPRGLWNVTFRHDKFDLPVSDAAPGASGTGTSRVAAERRATGPDRASRGDRVASNPDTSRALHGKLCVTWTVAAMVCAVASLFLHPDPQSSPDKAALSAPAVTPRRGFATAVEPASAEPKAPQAEPRVEPQSVNTLSLLPARRWDSHVALGRGNLAVEAREPDAAARIPKEHSTDGARRPFAPRAAPRSGAVSAQSRRGSTPTSAASMAAAASISVLDVPIAPPED
jgi:hypothetical protein